MKPEDRFVSGDLERICRFDILTDMARSGMIGRMESNGLGIMVECNAYRTLECLLASHGKTSASCEKVHDQTLMTQGVEIFGMHWLSPDEQTSPVIGFDVETDVLIIEDESWFFVENAGSYLVAVFVSNFS